MLLRGKRALITGGSRGIGREITLTFLREGASVYYISLNPGDSLDEYRAVAAESGTQVIYKEGNVADEETITAVALEILQESNGIDVLVNNAGITRDNLLFRMSSREWQDVLDINLNSAFYMSKVIGRQMMKNRSGSIINLTSITGIIGNGGQTNYATSKAGLIGFTKSMAREIGKRNVRVNAVAPGFINTRMTQKLNEEQKMAIQQNIPMDRIGEPQEVAKAVLFLASDLSSYITGHVLHVTGGLGM